MTIETYQRKPARVEMVLWNGSVDSFYEIRDWVGTSPDIGGPIWRFNPEGVAEIYNGEEHGWIPTPIGHRIVKSLRGTFHPISPVSLELGYDLVTE
jgi:hypothetical protein